MSAEPEDTPEFLTVEEAARLLRIGRTKAYALTQEWRATAGRAGLPVLDLGDVLRVPRAAIDQLVRDAMTSMPPPTPEPAPAPKRRQRGRSTPAGSDPGQTTLFDASDSPAA